jgi:hypothetical protein
MLASEMHTPMRRNIVKMKRLVAFAILIAGSTLVAIQPLMAFSDVVVVKVEHRRHHRSRHHHRPANRAVVVVKR